MPILLGPGITGEKDMAKTSPPHCVTLLIGLLLSGCQQKASDPGWHCTVLQDNETGEDMPVCYRQKEACQVSESACTPTRLAWCALKRQGWEESTGGCTHSQASCEKRNSSDCIQVE